MHAIDTTAPVVVSLTRTIDASLDTVWSLHTDLDDWPAWNAGIDRARLGGPPLVGDSFTWLTHGMNITSTIRELVPGRRIVWDGIVEGIVGIHVWTFEQTDAGVVVRTEEFWSGDPVDRAVEELAAALRTSLENWLDHLKARAEQPA
ncbi:SRPBCC family protein [Streptomyces sp. BE20]|uniref:SRPBCC family protein n=1 Tax=unclassified Streptomyces TaxID=2593676 RepID=UPI002E789A77|nr:MULTISPECIES: SRPBCC family protein [unclassified Streptomyces]MED7952586.1 SRPBCC family protein [Streptomyces sp. BE303]MEE1823697.1 SRPBCC family protein [Streptomyces sp. BE20]